LVEVNQQKTSDYPEIITRLPEAQIAFDGAKAWIHQSEGSQLVFFQFKAGTELPSHYHRYSQWGMVIEGEMEMIISGKPHIFKKGDEYLIPSRAAHSAKFFRDAREMDFFSEKSRYKPK